MKDPSNEHAGWFDDVRRIISTVETCRPGLPIPQISAERASFNFCGITHAEDAADAVAVAETILSYALDVTFTPKDVPRIGSSAHYILEGFTASGLAVDIMAKAEHLQPQDVRESVGVAA